MRKSHHYHPHIMKYQRNKDILVNIELESEINELFAKTKVVQKFKNPLTKNPFELKIYVLKKEGLLFSSFSSKIGNSITVKSKVIKKEKVEEKYSDTISKGNAAIFVSDDPENENRIIINMGNIPPKEEVIFISEFIYPTESSKKSYEFELFRNFPIFEGRGVRCKNSRVKGKIHIKTSKKLSITEKEILMKNLKISSEKYENKEKTCYIINYKIDKLQEFSPYNLDYIPSSKIYFKVENDNDKPIVFTQKSILNKDNIYYFIQYNIKTEKINEENTEEKPALFIFLIDQSGSMAGMPIKIASSALKLFLQSLPSKSYYQIIGFGTTFVKYDKSPKEYTKKNIDESLEQIDKLKADLGGTNIYNPLKDIYDSYNLYDKINLPKNIFLLTDGEITNKDKTLDLIEKNSSKFSVFSIGIGSAFDKDLIKNAGILGKGNYNFCHNINQLNETIATEISKAISPFISNIEIKTSLDKNNIIKSNNEHIPSIVREDEIINLNYITNDDKKDETIKIEIKYLENDKINEKKYEIEPLEIPEGEEFSKLIINNYLLNNSDLSEEEKIKLALKYQIFTNGTSLFAEVELSEKISKMNNRILISHYDYYDDFESMEEYANYGNSRNRDRDRCEKNYEESKAKLKKAKKIPSLYIEKKEKNFMNKKRERGKRDIDFDPELEEVEEKNFSNSEKIINFDEKEKVMKILRTQDFNKGNWDENNETKKIKEKYIKEYNLLKGLKDKKINDSIAMTIIIIYFIYKEYHELISELSRIIKKAKNFIRKETNTSYEKIIKQIGI